jgi:hypothetical protein
MIFIGYPQQGIEPRACVVTRQAAREELWRARRAAVAYADLAVREVAVCGKAREHDVRQAAYSGTPATSGYR